EVARRRGERNGFGHVVQLAQLLLLSLCHQLPVQRLRRGLVGYGSLAPGQAQRDAHAVQAPVVAVPAALPSDEDAAPSFHFTPPVWGCRAVSWGATSARPVSYPHG